MSGRLETDPLFVGLTRPSLLFGVNMKFAAINFMTSIIILINGGGIKVIIIAIFLHIVGYILSFRDPRFIEVFLTRNQTSPPITNRSFYSGNSYIA